MPSLIGSAPNQVPTNGLLGSAAFMEPDHILTKGSGAVTIASASTTDIATAASNVVNITGTTTITAFGNAVSGAERTLIFNGSLTITHNATSLICPGNQNMQVNAGDTISVLSLGSGNWKVTFYSASGTFSQLPLLALGII